MPLLLIILCVGLPPASAADAPGRPAVQEITSQQQGDATVITIKTDRPPVWTSYIMPQLWKGVIDLTGVDPGRIEPERSLAGGVVKRIVVRGKEVNDQQVTRISFDLATEAEMTVAADPADKTKLVATLKKGKFQSVEKLTAATEPEKAPQISAPARMEPAAEAKKTTLQPVVASFTDATTLTAVRFTNATLEIAADGKLKNARVFGIKKPNRLVIDLGGIRNGTKALPAMPKQSGIKAARIGTFEGNLRLVLDYGTDRLPTYQLSQSATGLTLSFPQR
jgi:hypothetical protein